MNISGHLAGTLLNNGLSIYNNATFTIYSGTTGVLPASVETLPTGSPLANWTLPEPAFPPLAFPITIVNGGVPITSNNIASPTQNPATGIAGYGRCWVWNWTQGATVAEDSYAFSNGTLYYTAAGGITGAVAPSATTGTIGDGTVVWAFVQAANNGTVGHAISDHVVGTSGADVNVGTTNFQNGANQIINSIQIIMPAN